MNQTLSESAARTLRGRKYLLLSLFFAGLGLNFGIMVQAVMFYLCAIIIPVWVNVSMLQRLPNKQLCKTLGILLLCAYFVFPISSVINYLFTDVGALIPGLIIPDNFRTGKLLSSRFSSAFGITGIVLLGLAYYPKRNSQASAPNKEAGLNLDFFSRGLMLGLVFILIVSGVQHFLGIDYRAPGMQMSAEDLMSDGRFRAQGLYGHPLTLATIMLTLFSFYYTQVLNFSEYYAHISKRSFWHFFFGVAIAICCSCFVLIFLSGSRVALLVGVAFFLVLPLIFSSRTGLKLKNLLILWVGGLSLLGASLFISGAYRRLWELVIATDLQSFLGNRLTFWKVHWQMFLDKPWFGQGYAYVEQFMRMEYYKKLGFEGVPQKFNAHNIYLEVLACAGTFGLVALAVIFVYFMTVLAREARKEWFSKVQYAAFFVAIVSNLIQGLTQNTFFDSSVVYIYLYLLWLLLWNMSEEISRA